MSKEVVEVGLETKAALNQARELESRLIEAGKGLGRAVTSGLTTALAAGGPTTSIQQVAAQAGFNIAEQVGGRLGGAAGAFLGDLIPGISPETGRAIGTEVGRFGVRGTAGRALAEAQGIQQRVGGFAQMLAAGGVKLSDEEVDELINLARPQVRSVMDAERQVSSRVYSVGLFGAAVREMAGSVAATADAIMGR